LCAFGSVTQFNRVPQSTTEPTLHLELELSLPCQQPHEGGTSDEPAAKQNLAQRLLRPRPFLLPERLPQLLFAQQFLAQEKLAER
jgi:hypothetical protein